jgi:hypothetical protein
MYFVVAVSTGGYCAPEIVLMIMYDCAQFWLAIT